MMILACLLIFVAILLPSKCFPRYVGQRRALQKMQAMEVVHLELPRDPYPVYIGADLLQKDILSKHIDCKKVLLVSNDKVGPVYCQLLKASLQRHCGHQLQVFEVILRDGEQFKTMESVQMILDASLEYELDRKSIFVALGGGVVGDICGFAAAIYQRGVRFVQVPTSLMAMVDSSVGGKTGVNHVKGKNLIGAFHQPIAVLADVAMLDSLPRREYLSGLAEVVKYGLIGDAEFFSWMEENTHAIINRDETAVMTIITKSCRNKAAIVASDEKESMAPSSKQHRMLLNLGHTFGHAIETCAGYGSLLHGEAVSIGIMMAADLSHRMGFIGKAQVLRIKALLEALQLPTSLQLNEQNTIRKDKFIQAMSMDKKSIDGNLSLVLLRGELGQAFVTTNYDAQLLAEVVEEYCQAGGKEDPNAADSC